MALFTMPPTGGEVSLWMHATPAAVWHLVSDVTRIGELSPETFEGRWTHGWTGPEPGARFSGHVRRSGLGLTYWSPCQVTVCEPERQFEFTVGPEHNAVDRWGYRLLPDNGGTEVTEYFQIEPGGPVLAYWRLFGRGRRRTNMHGMRTTLERMKVLVEAQA